MKRPAAPPAVVYRWDLDKTYLRTEFTTLRQLLRTALETGEDKVEVPGVAELVKALRAAGERGGRRVGIYFLSASPPQIGKAIRDKLALDGVPYDGIVFKNQLQHLRPGKLHNLREHVGYKLVELLRGRLESPPGAREVLFGDDWESDSLIYSLYADLLAGRLEVRRLGPILRRLRVDPQLIEQATVLASRAAGTDAVERIFINLERRTPPAIFQLFGPRVVPTFNYFQTAAVLAAAGHLAAAEVARVARALAERAAYTPRRLENSLDDLVRRGHLTGDAADTLARPLRAAGVLPPETPAGPRWRRALRALGRLGRVGRRPRRAPAARPPAVDYEAVLDRLRPAANGGKKG
jgi:hypothetical protein